MTKVATRPVSRGWVSLSIAGLLVGLIIGIFAPGDRGGWTTAVLVFTVVFVLLPFVITSLTEHDWFHPFAFPALYVAFVFAAPVTYAKAFGVRLGTLEPEEITPQLMALMLVAMVGLLLGVLLMLRAKPTAAIGNQSPLLYRRVLSVGHYGLVILVLTQAVLAIRSAGLPYGFGQIEYDLDAVVGVVAGSLILPTVILTTLGSVRLTGRLLDGASQLLLAVLIALLLVQGDRNQTLSVLIFLTWMQNAIRPIRLSRLVAGTAVVLAGVILVGGIRADSNPLPTGQPAAERLLGDLSSTSGITADLMQRVPDQHPYTRGSTYMAALKNLAPGPISRSLFGDPATATFVYRDIIDLDNPNHGVGFSFIAEAYLNFGWFGVAALSFGLGMLLAWAWRSSSPYPTTAAALLYPVLISLLPYLLRSDALTQIKLAGYALIACVIVFRVSRTGAPAPQSPPRRPVSAPSSRGVVRAIRTTPGNAASHGSFGGRGSSLPDGGGSHGDGVTGCHGESDGLAELLE